MARKGEVNHYAAGLTLIVVGTFGIIGSLTGELANMLAALWAPDSLSTSTGSPASAHIPGAPGWLNDIANFFKPKGLFQGPGA